MTQEQKIIQIIKKSLPAVVSITILKPIRDIEREKPQWLFPLFEKDARKRESLFEKMIGSRLETGGGSGFIVDRRGLIITNLHVVSEGCLDYEVALTGGKKYPARLIGSNLAGDVAFLKITEQKDFPVLTLGDSSKIELGQTVIAIGNALGMFSNTISSGIVSGLSRSIEASNEERTENLRGLIQTDAAINPGNSGGPLLDLSGKVIGINSANVAHAENISFAIPINAAKNDLQDIKKYGKIRRAFLGVRYIILDETTSQLLDIDVKNGMYVKSPSPKQPAIIKGSSAAKAGLKEQDIIIAINGVLLNKDFTLQDFLEESEGSQKAKIRILRDGKEKILEAILEERN